MLILFRILLSLSALITGYCLYTSHKNEASSKTLQVVNFSIATLLIRDIIYLAAGGTWIVALGDLIWPVLFHYLSNNSDMSKSPTVYRVSGLGTLALIISLFLQVPQLWLTRLLLTLCLGTLTLSVITSLKNRRIVSPKQFALLSLTLYIYYGLAIYGGYRTSLFMDVRLLIANCSFIFILLSVIKKTNDNHKVTIFRMTKEKASNLKFLKDVSLAMITEGTMEAVNNNILQFIMDRSHAESGAILMADSTSHELVISAKSGPFLFPGPVEQEVKTDITAFNKYFSVGQTIPADSFLDRHHTSGKPVLIKDTFRIQFDKLFRENTANNLLYISSIIVVPLSVNNRPVGVICLENHTPGHNFTDELYETVRTLSLYGEIMISNIFINNEIIEKRNLERDVEMSRTIQQSLLPNKLPRIEGTSFAVYSKPARYVSGDYYDFIELQSGKIAFLVCDVAGKGVAAGLIMSVIRTTIHQVIKHQNCLDSVLTRVNQAILDVGGDNFATAFFFVFDPRSNTLEYTNAAHLPAIIYNQKTGSTSFLDTPGLPLGIDPATNYTNSSTLMKSGDILYLYTDGINETLNDENEQFGTERIADVVQKSSTENSEIILHNIKQSIDQFSENLPQHDDQTFLIMKVS